MAKFGRNGILEEDNVKTSINVKTMVYVKRRADQKKADQARHWPKGIQKAERSHPTDAEQNHPMANIRGLNGGRRLVSKKREVCLM